MTKAVRIPWFVWTSLASVTCILVGTYWDISWHMSIGRDSFWTPAHLLIQAGGIFGGLGGASAILFGRRDPDTTIRVWGFRGPFGAFLAVWGAATMVVSAPFDDWWHRAYGLDVKIISPPHMVLTIGILAVAVGALLQVARVRARTVLLLLGGEIVTLMMIAILEMTFRSNLHTAAAYRAIAINAPIGLLALAGAADRRWAATAIAGFYTVFMAAMVWIFPLFAAEPKLGPVYQPITHMIPLEFPLLIVVPAVALDLGRAALARWPRWAQAPVLGLAFMTTLVAAEWPFATFLQSEGARNAVFGASYFAYFLQPDWFLPTHTFVPDGQLWSGLAIATATASVSAWLGLLLGDAIRAVRR
jgi:hypothetical protein